MAELEVPITQASEAISPEDYITPPDWAVRLVSTNFGKRGRPYPTTWVGRGYAGPDDYPFGMGGYNGGYSTPLRSDENRPIKGNLPEVQYRFWNGSSNTSSDIATCRWCRMWCYGAEAMRTHQGRTDHSRILREIYDFARTVKGPLCFTCGKKTTHTRWGVPLHDNNKCLNTWRVGAIVEVSRTLHLYAKWARGKGILNTWLNEDGSEKYNHEVNPKKFDWDRADAY